jgi:hypothetical protein
MEPRRIDIDGVTYELREWSPEDGERWLMRFVTVLGKNAGAFLSERIAVGAVLGAIDEQLLLDFWSTCRKYTARIGVDDRPNHEGEETVLILDRNGKSRFAVPYFAMFKLMREHAEGQYSDFFARLGELLGLSAMENDESPSPKE